MRLACGGGLLEDTETDDAFDAGELFADALGDLAVDLCDGGGIILL